MSSGGSILRAWLPACVALLTACGSTVRLPDAQEVSPAQGIEGAATSVTIRGASFRPVVTLDFDRPSTSPVDTSFSVVVGDVAAANVTWVSEGELNATVPGTLPLGTWDVTVIDPRGATDVIPGGFTVIAPAGRLFLESNVGGTGQPLGDRTMQRGTALALFAVARTDDGGFLADVHDATWTLDGGIGTLAVDPDGGATLWVDTAGEGVVTAAHPLYGSASTGRITVEACATGADCVDACHSTGQCNAGTCTQGPADLDADSDTYVDMQCVGGNDCDDSAAAVNPAAVEEGYATALCLDGADNDCDGLADALDPDCAPNSAPLARLTVTPPSGAPGDTFSGSGSASSDRESPQSALQFDWDWDDDGTFEAAGVTSTHVFSASGLFRVSLKVTDPQGLSGIGSYLVIVGAAASTATVTTGLDESNAGATPGNPGGAGFSLREAIAWAQATAGREIIVVPPGTTVALTRQLTITSGDGLVIVGDGAVVDGAAIPGSGSSCFDLSGANHGLLGVEIRNCPGWAIFMQATNSRASRCSIHDSMYGVEWAGTDNLFGPFNQLYGNGSFGIEVDGRARVESNWIHDNRGPGVILRNAADDSVLVGNVIYDNTEGVRAVSQCDRVALRFNTVHGNAGAGISLANNTSGHKLLNTIVSGNGGWGLDVQTATFTSLDANDLFGNTLGGCRNCASLGPKTLAVDPKYVDASARDLRLDLMSPLVNAGIATGDDRTLSIPGDFLGTAPDMGAYEVK